MEKDFEQIKDKLFGKAVVKYEVYKSLLNFFEHLKAESKQLCDRLSKEIAESGNSIEADYTEHSPFEFRLVVGGDTLVVVLQSNVVALNPEHFEMKSDYIKAQRPHVYFGQIVFYNFLTDSFRFNRFDDLGYLVCRIFLDKNENFMVEGHRQVQLAFGQMKDTPASSLNAKILMLAALNTVLDNDLQAPDFELVQVITLAQKENYTITAARGSKIGFKPDLNTGII
jgi:hypothetical protein